MNRSLAKSSHNTQIRTYNLNFFGSYLDFFGHYLDSIKRILTLKITMNAH